MAKQQKVKLPERREYEMTPDEFMKFKSARNPGKIVLLNAPTPLTAEERAILFWTELGRKHRFMPETAEPILDDETKHKGWFTAIPLPEPTEHDDATVH